MSTMRTDRAYGPLYSVFGVNIQPEPRQGNKNITGTNSYEVLNNVKHLVGLL